MIYSDFKDDFNSFLSHYGFYIALAIVFIIIVVIVLLLLINRKRKNKPINKQDNKEMWLSALGGKDNIVEISATGSRLNLKLIDQNAINKEQLKQLGVSNILIMSDKIVLVVLENADKIKEKLD